MLISIIIRLRTLPDMFVYTEGTSWYLSINAGLCTGLADDVPEWRPVLWGVADAAPGLCLGSLGRIFSKAMTVSAKRQSHAYRI